MAWERIKDPASGRAYYYNEETQVTQWEFPEEVLDAALHKHGWDKATTDSNGTTRTYFFSGAGESLWDVPEPVLLQLQASFGQDLSQEEIKGEVVDEPQEDEEAERQQQQQSDEKGEEGEEATEEERIDSGAAAGEQASIGEIGEIVPLVNKLIDLDALVASTEEQKDVEMTKSEENPEDAFLGMLKEAGVDSACTFTDVIRKCSRDPRYWAVRDPVLRSRLFEVYLVKKADEDFIASKEKYRDEFYKLLAKHNVKYYTRWMACSKGLQDEKLFSILSERIKREFFDEYTAELRKEKEAASKELKAKESVALEEEFRATVNISSEFAKIVSELEEKYKNLTKGEMLSIFEKIIAERELEQVAIVEVERKKNYRVDRKARAAFKGMLDAMIASKEFVPTSKTRWFEFVALIKDKSEFVELCGHHGSSAIDYYWDMLDEVYRNLDGKREVVKQQLINSNRKIGDLAEDEFVELMRGCNKEEVSSLCEDDLRTLYGIMRRAITANSTAVKRPAETEFASSTEKRQRILLRKNNA